MTIKNKSGRKRSISSRDAILKKTLSLLEVNGFNKLSIEEIASHAGVGKSTIYRWWPNKRQLVMEAFLEYMNPAVPFLDSGDSCKDLLNQIRSVGKTYRERSGKILIEVLAQGQTDQLILNLFTSEFLIPRKEKALLVIERGIKNNEFRSEIDPSIVVDILYAPIFFRMLMKYESIDDDFIINYVSLILNSISVNDIDISMIVNEV